MILHDIGWIVIDWPLLYRWLNDAKVNNALVPLPRNQQFKIIDLYTFVRPLTTAFRWNYLHLRRHFMLYTYHNGPNFIVVGRYLTYIKASSYIPKWLNL